MTKNVRTLKLMDLFWTDILYIEYRHQFGRLGQIMLIRISTDKVRYVNLSKQNIIDYAIGELSFNGDRIQVCIL